MVGRTIIVTEAVRLRMQVQAYNVFNNTDPDARNFQVVLRILW